MKQKNLKLKYDERLTRMSKEELLERVSNLEKENINLKQGIENLNATISLKILEKKDIDYTIKRFPLRLLFNLLRRFSYFRLKNTIQ